MSQCMLVTTYECSCGQDGVAVLPVLCVFAVLTLHGLCVGFGAVGGPLHCRHCMLQAAQACQACHVMQGTGRANLM